MKKYHKAKNKQIKKYDKDYFTTIQEMLKKQCMGIANVFFERFSMWG